LEVPVACTPGTDCFIQNYVDHDAGKGWKDYRCGHLSYDGHDGTDFRLPTLKEMEAGVNVLAAADGVVKNTRDSMKDTGLHNTDPTVLKGRECGNGVMIEHEDGWSTQYCHMKLGSITVKPGDEVSAGSVLGQVGMSGMAEFPHLHLTVRHDQEVVDPFTGLGRETSCGQSGASAWMPEAEKALAYKPPGLIAAGFSTQEPTFEGILEGKFNETSIHADAPALLFWVEVYGPREGDVLKLTLTRGGEGGEVVAQHEETLTNSKAQYMQYIDKKSLEPGEYDGHFTLTRTTEKDGAQILVTYEGQVNVE